jgi:DNA-binding MarR family transcriptional regulator
MMTDQREDDQLENAIETLLSGGDVPQADAEITELATVASRLRGLPSPSFKARLTRDLRRHMEGQPQRAQGWRFLTNHAMVLIHVYEHPRSTLREIAGAVGITERAALSILRQLEAEDCVQRAREGRRTRYTVNLHPVMAAQAQGPYNIKQLVRQLAHLAEGSASSDAG